MPSTTTAIAGAAATNSAIANAQAQEAKKLACTARMRGFEHNTATVMERQQYAECVDLVHPAPMSAGGALLLKASIVCAIIGAAVKAYRATGVVSWSPSIGDRLFDGMLGGFLGFCVPWGLALAAAAVMFLVKG